MTQVYIEWFVLDNLLMAYLIIRTAAVFVRLEMRRWGVLLACVVSTGVAVLAMLYPVFLSFPAKAALLAVMCVPFCARTVREWGRAALCVLIATFLLGGLAYALTGVLEGGFAGGVLYASSAVRGVMICALLSIWMPKLFRKLTANKQLESLYMRLRIETAFGAAEVSGKLDTGNTLTTPLENLPVLVIDPVACAKVLPESWRTGDWKEHPVAGMSVVPFNTVEGGGVMPALNAKVYLLQEAGWVQGPPCRVALSVQRLISCAVLVNAFWAVEPDEGQSKGRDGHVRSMPWPAQNSRKA